MRGVRLLRLSLQGPFVNNTTTGSALPNLDRPFNISPFPCVLSSSMGTTSNNRFGTILKPVTLFQQAQKPGSSIYKKDRSISPAPMAESTASSSLPDKFVHEPLDLPQSSIRVLQILPGRSKDTIRCVLKNVPRQNHAYVCLSYIWGEPQP